MKTRKRTTIGVDLGGHHLRTAAVDERGAIFLHRKMTVGDKSVSAIVAAIVAEVRAIADQIGDEPHAVGCGVPGIVDHEQGVVYASPHFPAWRDAPLRKALADALHLPVVMDNDANCHALAESLAGAGRSHRNIVLLTLGTGIGGGLVFDGRVFHGDAGFAGEVGHIVVEPEGQVCGCGGRGCLELYAASTAFSVHAQRLPAPEREALLAAAGVELAGLTPEVAARLAEQGNVTAVRLWNEFGRYLGIGIATLVNVLGVLTFVVGGGISRSWERFIAPARASALAHTYPRHADHLLIKRAELGEDAGMIGAGLLARELSAPPQNL